MFTTPQGVLISIIIIIHFAGEQVIHDEESDELATYFRCEVVPKVLITSSDRSKVVSGPKGVCLLKIMQHAKKCKKKKKTEWLD